MSLLAPVNQRLYSVIKLMNHYSLGKHFKNLTSHPVDRGLSSRPSDYEITSSDDLSLSYWRFEGLGQFFKHFYQKCAVPSMHM